MKGYEAADKCQGDELVSGFFANLLKRLADGMDMVLKIEFVPKQKN